MLIGQVEPSQIEEWKKKHGTVKGLICDGHIAYIRPPNRTEVSYSATLAQTNPMKSNEVLLDSVWLGGSEEIRKNDSLFYGVSQKLAELINVKEAQLVDL